MNPPAVSREIIAAFEEEKKQEMIRERDAIVKATTSASARAGFYDEDCNIPTTAVKNSS